MVSVLQLQAATEPLWTSAGPDAAKDGKQQKRVEREKIGMKVTSNIHGIERRADQILT